MHYKKQFNAINSFLNQCNQLHEIAIQLYLQLSCSVNCNVKWSTQGQASVFASITTWIQYEAITGFFFRISKIMLPN